MEQPGTGEAIGKRRAWRWILILITLLSSGSWAAEIRGSVAVERSGLFGSGQDNSGVGAVSIALFPLHGVSSSSPTQQTHRIEVRGNQIQPLYLAIQQSDSVRFENHDDVYHELFSLSDEEPFSLRLGKAGQVKDSIQEVRFNRSATWHLFCRIHARTYARIDVLDTPYIKMIQPDEKFEFRNLVPGKWRMRIAMPGAETLDFETMALTSPPPVRTTMTVKGGGEIRQDYTARHIGVEALFPAHPGF